MVTTLYQETVALTNKIFDALMENVRSDTKEEWEKDMEELREFDSIRMNLLKFMERKSLNENGYIHFLGSPMRFRFLP